MRQARTTFYSSKETYECKFARKRRYLVCSVKYKVHFSTSSDEVVVEKAGEDHKHELDVEYENMENPHYMRWTPEQTAIVLIGCKNNLDPTTIRRNLKEINGTNPTSQQLNNKISYSKKAIFVENIVSTGELRDALAQMLEEPDDESDLYVSHQEVIDDKGEDEVRFLVIFTTKRMKSRLSLELC